jgi:hypothetical protein
VLLLTHLHIGLAVVGRSANGTTDDNLLFLHNSAGAIPAQGENDSYRLYFTSCSEWAGTERQCNTFGKDRSTSVHLLYDTVFQRAHEKQARVTSPISFFAAKLQIVWTKAAAGQHGCSKTSTVGG